MNQLNLRLGLVALLTLGVTVHARAQDQIINATGQQGRPPRGRGPYPGSATPSHSAGLPIQIKLLIPSNDLRPDRSTLIDFLITNVGTDPIRLPSSVVLFNSEPRQALTLWLTSDGIRDQYFKDIQSGRLIKIEMVSISAELDAASDEPGSFYVLAPSKSIRVHASSPQLKAGNHAFTAHAQLLQVSNGRSELLGTADSEAVEKLLVVDPNAR
jgi:hypothetical protein